MNFGEINFKIKNIKYIVDSPTATLRCCKYGEHFENNCQSIQLFKNFEMYQRDVNYFFIVISRRLFNLYKKNDYIFVIILYNIPITQVLMAKNCLIFKIYFSFRQQRGQFDQLFTPLIDVDIERNFFIVQLLSYMNTFSGNFVNTKQFFF